MSETSNDAVELENAVKAESADAAGENQTSQAENGDVAVMDRADDGDTAVDTERADTAGSYYACGLNETGMRRLIRDIDYRNRGRPGHGFSYTPEGGDSELMTRVLDHQSVRKATSHVGVANAVMALVVESLGRKHRHPRGR